MGGYNRRKSAFADTVNSASGFTASGVSSASVIISAVFAPIGGKLSRISFWGSQKKPDKKAYDTLFVGLFVMKIILIVLVFLIPQGMFPLSLLLFSLFLWLRVGHYFELR